MTDSCIISYYVLVKFLSSLVALNKVSDRTVKTRQGLNIGTVWLLYQLAKRLGIVDALGRSGKANLVLRMIISAAIGCNQEDHIPLKRHGPLNSARRTTIKHQSTRRTHMDEDAV